MQHKYLAKSDHWITIILLFVIFFIAFDVSGQENLVFILDASGSMWGQIEGHPKISIAKDVMKDLINGLPDDTKVGLIAYGHRRKGDCDDVEELVSLGTLDRRKLINEINSINPKGKTPITHSIRQTTERLRGLEDATTIILVSDGKETCEGDPCALVKTLQQSGIKFVMHVVGFDVTAKEREQLECIAQASGGSYYAARNASEFRIAARKAVEISTPIPITVGYLEITALKNGQNFEAPFNVFITGETIPIDSGWTRADGPSKLELAPGVYDVEVEDKQVPDHPKVSFRVKIRLGETVGRTADFSDGTLKVLALKSGQPFNAEASVYVPGQSSPFAKRWTHGTNTATFNLPPGTYDIVVEGRGIATTPKITLSGVEVAPNQILEKTVEFTDGTLKVLALKNGQPFNAEAFVYVPGQSSPFAKHWTHGANTATFNLPPGTYDIVVEGRGIATIPKITLSGVEVAPNQILEKTVEFTDGTLKVLALKNGQLFNANAHIYISDQSNELTRAWTHGANTATFNLPPGVYDVKVVDESDGSFKMVESVHVEEGKTKRIEVAF